MYQPSHGIQSWWRYRHMWRWQPQTPMSINTLLAPLMTSKPRAKERERKDKGSIYRVLLFPRILEEIRLFALFRVKVYIIEYQVSAYTLWNLLSTSTTARQTLGIDMKQCVWTKWNGLKLQKVCLGSRDTRGYWNDLSSRCSELRREKKALRFYKPTETRQQMIYCPPRHLPSSLVEMSESLQKRLTTDNQLQHENARLGWCSLPSLHCTCCEPSFPLQHSKNCPKFVPAIVFEGSSQGGLEVVKIVLKIRKTVICRQFLTIFLQIPVPLTGTLKHNRWDKFWTNWRFGAILNTVNGKRVGNALVLLLMFTACSQIRCTFRLPDGVAMVNEPAFRSVWNGKSADGIQDSNQLLIGTCHWASVCLSLRNTRMLLKLGQQSTTCACQELQEITSLSSLKNAVYDLESLCEPDLMVVWLRARATSSQWYQPRCKARPRNMEWTKDKMTRGPMSSERAMSLEEMSTTMMMRADVLNVTLTALMPPFMSSGQILQISINLHALWPPCSMNTRKQSQQIADSSSKLEASLKLIWWQISLLVIAICDADSRKAFQEFDV